jgi:amino acid permease
LFDKFCKCIYFLSWKSNRFNDKIIEPLYYVKGIILLKKIFIYFPESIQSQNLIINNVEVVNWDFNYFLLRLDYVNRFGRESIFEDF